MDREDFMDIVYSELHSDGDNNRANRIIEAADEYAESVQLGTNLAEVDTDTISRQAAIDVVKGIDSHFVKYVEQLPSAQPEPCEDAVSRKAVKDGFVEMCSLICPYTEKQRHIMCGSCLLGTAFDVLEATQPVTPKQRTGKWIPKDGRYHCDQCSGIAPKGIRWDFCPHCGAEMKGANNEGD